MAFTINNSKSYASNNNYNIIRFIVGMCIGITAVLFISIGPSYTSFMSSISSTLLSLNSDKIDKDSFNSGSVWLDNVSIESDKAKDHINDIIVNEIIENKENNIISSIDYTDNDSRYTGSSFLAPSKDKVHTQIQSTDNVMKTNIVDESRTLPSTTSPTADTVSTAKTIFKTLSSWVPGKEGSFARYKELSKQISNEFVTSPSDADQASGNDSPNNNQDVNIEHSRMRRGNRINHGSSNSALGLSRKEKIEYIRQHKKVEHVLTEDNMNENENTVDSLKNSVTKPEISIIRNKNISSCCYQMYNEVTGERLSDEHVNENSISVTPYPILQSYHEQAHKLQLDVPYSPSLDVLLSQRNAVTQALESPNRYLPNTKLQLSNKINLDSIPVPNMQNQKAEFEKENLKLHLCNGVFEAYSASWLTTREHMIEVKSEGYNLTWVNCEMASFIHMRESNNFYINPDGKGMVMQSLDVLDFSVIHLSTFERSSKKYMMRLWNTRQERAQLWSRIDPIKEAVELLENKVNPLKSKQKIVYSEDAKNTVVIMPFLGGAMGAGHSELGNRFEYLKLCFWSFYEFIPNIVAGVSRQEDVDWAFKESGLPFYDVLLLDNLPKSAGLPVGTTQKVKQKLVNNEWDFKYIFFTESDQILISRELQMMYDHLKKYPSRMILPHRLMVYSDRIMKEIHKKTIDLQHNKWMTQSCCMPRQNCNERKDWKPIAHDDVHVINYYGLYVPLGNVNFLTETYRTCKIGEYVPYCP